MTVRRLVLTAIAMLPAALAAQQPAGQPAGATPQRPQSPFRPFAELTKDAVVRTGFFDTYQKEDKLYLAVPKDRLGKGFLMEMKVAQGIGRNFLTGGEMMTYEGNVVALERHGDQIYLVQLPHRFTADKDAAAAKSVQLTFGSSVLDAAKIESFRDDSAMVVDVSNWFISDLSGVGQTVRAEVSTTPGRLGQANFDRQRSYLESVKGFPQNLNVRTKLTFRPVEPVGFPSVPDSRFISVSVHYSWAALPEVPMTPRYGDDRVGNFWNVHKDFSQDDSTTFVRFVNRWRLEPGERVGDKFRPKKQIVYYIDPSVPVQYRATMKAGVEAWNAAFEAAGWVDAIRAADLPEGADAEDIRYPTLRWNVSDQPGYGAIGPSVTDPRTGEILDADILFESTFFGGFRSGWRTLAGPVSAGAAGLNEVLGVGTEIQNLPPGTELPTLASNFAAQGGLLQAALIARGELAPNEALPDRYVMQAVKWATMHEVGHTLGLQHNFRSSASTPNGKLHDQSWAESNGLYGSVMEYPSVNLAPKGQPNGFFYTPGVGSYDKWVISYGYTPDNARAASLARQVASKGHLYGNNAESGGPGALDPSINIWDLGDDPLAWSRQRTGIIRDLIKDLPAKALADNDSYLRLTAAYQSLMNQYGQAIAPAMKYLGGAYINRDHVGDPEGRLPFENIPRAKQREALDLIVERLFAENALAVPPAVLQRMGSNRWLHWGSNTTFGGRLDFPYHEQTLGLQGFALGALLDPFRLSRIRDAETRWGASSVVTIPEMMGALSRAIWTETWGPGPRNTSATRRDLQRAYVDQMTQILVQPAARTPADARAVARMQLKDLNRRLTTALAAGDSLDAYTRAHLDESRARIDKALTAGLEAERR